LRPIPEGYEARLGVVVTDEMTVEFGELGALHPVYATYWMAKHMEEAARKLILDFLDDDEDGVGSAVSVRHLAPTLPGMRIEVIARHVRTEANRIFAECRAVNEAGGVVGEGSTEQVVLPAAQIKARLRRRFST
jgi:fluoroacetyl-CoA thioesterase